MIFQSAVPASFAAGSAVWHATLQGPGEFVDSRKAVWSAAKRREFSPSRLGAGTKFRRTARCGSRLSNGC
eukprot:2456932-Rhodomonas_salina.1